ncbi:MAG: serine hydrolase domain-containing protein [Actinomycetota bacterium]|nr:serine hydrolase domain-containing protein [Actinomycetota bacterium]
MCAFSSDRNRRSVIFHLLISLLLLSLTFITSCDTASAPALSRETRVGLGAALDEALSQSGSPGAIAGVWTPEGDWVVAKGEANLETGESMQTTDIFRIGSITKTFVATVVLTLVDDGLLSLGDKLSEYYPDFPRADEITVRMLLNHTSGIFSWDEDEAVFERIYEDPDAGWTIEGMIQLSAEHPFYFDPGTGQHYSNINYFLLGMIIEEVTRQTLREAIAERVTEPLGLENTFLPDGPTYEGESMRGYDEVDGELVDVTGSGVEKVISYDLAWAAGGMVTTLAGLKVWARALATGELLSPAMHREQMDTVDTTPEGGPLKTGYGLGVNVTGDWVGHSGAVVGSMCNMGYDPVEDATIITYFNKLSTSSLEANEADIEAYSGCFHDMVDVLYPEQGEN